MTYLDLYKKCIEDCGGNNITFRIKKLGEEDKIYENNLKPFLYRELVGYDIKKHVLILSDKTEHIEYSVVAYIAEEKDERN